MGLKESVQALCKRKGVTAQQAEIDLGFGKGYISKLNTSIPNAGNIQKMAAYFGVSFDYIMNGTETEKAPTPEGEPIHLSGTYLRLAQGAQELGLDDEDVDAILAIYKKHLQKNQ